MVNPEGRVDLIVDEVAARYGVSTEAVLTRQSDGRLAGTRSPDGSFRIPAAQLEHDGRSATGHRQLDDLKQHLLALHASSDLPSEDEITASVRAQD